MHIHSDILDRVHGVLLPEVNSVAATTHLNLPSKGRPFIMRGLFSCAMLPRQVVNRDATRCYRWLVQSKIVVTRPPPEEPTVRKALTVATTALPALSSRDSGA